LLLDCAPTAAHRMAVEKCDWANLDAIWISHFHLDHCGGLAPFLAGTRVAPETRSRTKPLRIFGPKGLRGLIEKFDAVNGYKLTEQPFPLEIIEVETLEKFEIFPGVAAVAMKTPHTPESHAIHIRDNDDRTLVYTSDTGFHEPLSSFARHVDLFITECSCVKDKPTEKHLELAEAMFLIRKAEPKRAMLTHLYPEWDDVDFEKEVSLFSPMCDVIEALDGLAISFPDNG
jgi:ribonuclease BN (tRNA processing enzyme)